MPISGCKQILIPLLIAVLFIFVMLAVGTESNQYSTPIAEFEPREGVVVRLEGDVRHIEPESESFRVTFCDAGRCINGMVAPREAARLRTGIRVIVSGRWNGGTLSVSRVLTRCHQD